MPNLVGVYREPEYSPGRVEDDAAILERTRDALAARGVTMTLGAAELVARHRPDAALAMCQSAPALDALASAAATIPVINAPEAIRSCYRHETVQRLARTTVPFPETCMVSTAERPAWLAERVPCWVKRGDVHAMSSDDVVFVVTLTELTAELERFAARGIARVALQAHIEGTVVKFYGVADGRFFRCYSDGGDVPAPLPTLWDAAYAGASALGLEIFGGDLVVASDGRPVLVDVNDWPSFARCRDEAAEAIAGYVVDRLADRTTTARTP